MKRIIFPILFMVAISFSVIGQTLNRIPPGAAVNYPNGWYKFINQGVTFDVEILNKTLTQGNIIWFDQTKYSGTLAGYTISGKGTYTWKDGRRYEGSFKDNKRHSWGTMYYLDGTRYDGKWKNNKKQGKGKAYDKDGNLVQQGVWDNDVFIGTKKKRKKKS